MPPSRPRLYLAGPTVFEPDPKAICTRHGLDGVSPPDNQIELHCIRPGRPLAEAIVDADIALMHGVDAGIFCLDSFRRGPEMDPGTAFEIGTMHALGKPPAGWTRDGRLGSDRVAACFDGALTVTPPGVAGGTSGALRDPDGVLVHSEGCYQNAMTDMAIARSSSIVAADPEWAVAFEQAVRHLAGRLIQGARD